MCLRKLGELGILTYDLSTTCKNKHDLGTKQLPKSQIKPADVHNSGAQNA